MTKLSPRVDDFAEKRRILQLETLYDLALALHADRSEQDLVEEVLHLVCAVLDPASAVAVARGVVGQEPTLASVGWRPPPAGQDLFEDGLWRRLLAEGAALVGRDGVLAGRPYRQLLAAPFDIRGVFLGYIALLDKETRGDGKNSDFTTEDRRFLDSVAALAGVALDSCRQLADLADQRERLAEENKALRGRLVEELAGHRIVAQAPPMRRVLEVVERVAPRNVGILLRGESGTGKELVAKLLHSLSGRSGPLVAINCAAMPEALLESELFGIEGGVATGVSARRGKFELADGGTLFLDEIGDMERSLQVKLLRALQEREVTHVGGQRPVSVDVRVIAATHRQIERRVANQRFREDLYYRLKGVEIELPPLRERRQDVPHLTRLFLDEFCQREGIEAPTIDPEASALLLAYDYPGNVRELQNLIQGGASLADSVIDADLLRSLIGEEQAGSAAPLELSAVERQHIQRVLRMTGGNKSAAARILGVDRRTLQRKGL